MRRRLSSSNGSSPMASSFTVTIAIGRERARIAQDMHDDLGASLTNIALLGEVVKQNRHRTDLVQTEAEKISNIAGGLVDNLSELVWATNPKYDSLPDLVSYLREKAGSFFEDDSIQCHLDFLANVPDQGLAGNVRRNLYLSVKEALHNVLKHSGATEVWVRLRCVTNGPMSVGESPELGRTGHRPVPSAKLPEGTNVASVSKPGVGCNASDAAIPVGKLPTRAGESPAPPII